MQTLATVDHGVKATRRYAVFSAGLLCWGLLLTAYAAISQIWVIVALGAALLIVTAIQCRYWLGKLGRSKHNEWARHMNATWFG